MESSVEISPASLVDLAERCARAAGAQLRDSFASGRLVTLTKTTPSDLVSEADFAAERLIRDMLAAERPDDAILGEEEGDSHGSSGLRWVVDPLDGTVNYLHGIPQWSVSIACEDASGAVAGVVYDPMRDELWSARAGEPAQLDGVPVAASGCRVGAEALLATGFGYAAEVRAVQARVIATLLPQVRDIRRFGSAALDLAWTSAGRVDGYFERGVQHWDIAAGVLMCECSGLAVAPLPALDGAPEGLVVGTADLVADLAPRLGAPAAG